MKKLTNFFLLAFSCCLITFTACKEDDSDDDTIIIIDPTAKGNLLDSTFTFTSGWAQENDYSYTYGSVSDYGSFDDYGETREGYSVYLSADDNLSCDNQVTPTFGLRVNVPTRTATSEDSVAVTLYHPNVSYSYRALAGPNQIVEFTEVNDSMIYGTVTFTSDRDTLPVSVTGEFEVSICDYYDNQVIVKDKIAD